MTPRFCTVKIEKVFESKERALEAGYTEPTYYRGDCQYGVLGKSVSQYEMTFAGYKT